MKGKNKLFLKVITILSLPQQKYLHTETSLPPSNQTYLRIYPMSEVIIGLELVCVFVEGLNQF